MDAASITRLSPKQTARWLRSVFEGRATGYSPNSFAWPEVQLESFYPDLPWPCKVALAQAHLGLLEELRGTAPWTLEQRTRIALFTDPAIVSVPELHPRATRLLVQLLEEPSVTHK